MLKWKDGINALIPPEIGVQQFEYAIAKSSRQKENETVNEQIISLLGLMLHLAEKNREIKVLNNEEHLLKALSIESVRTALLQAYLDKIEAQSFSKVVIVRPEYLPLLLDHLLRWVVLWLFVDFDFFDSDNFGVSSILFLPLGMIIWLMTVSRRNQVLNKELIARYQLQGTVTTRKVGTTSYYVFLAFILLISVGVNYLLTLTQFAEYSIFPVGASFFIWIIYLFIYDKLSESRLSEKQLLQQLNDDIDFSKRLGVDQNDEVIVRLSSQLKALTGRLEAYVLESALFGALAFSGFLQIMAEELVSFEDLELFANSVTKLLSSFVIFSWDNNGAVLDQLSSKSSLFSLISVETLLCSILFLAVIASRLRFSNIADKVDHHLNLAMAYNAKEEALIHQKQDHQDQRLEQINHSIHVQLNETNIKLDQIQSIKEYMQFFRNAGILTFLVILISSGLFISPIISIIFSGLGIGSIIYFNKEHLSTATNTLGYYVQNLAINNSYLMALASLVLLVVGTFLSLYFQISFYWIFISLAFMLFLGYRLASIFLLPQFDEGFRKDKTLSKATKILWGLAESMLILGLWMMILTVPGVGLTLGLGTGVMIIAMFNLSLPFTSRWYVGVLIGLAIAVGITGILFRLLTLPGSKALLVTTLITLVLVGLSGLIFKYKIHRILFRQIIGLFIFGLYVTFIFHLHRTAIHLQTSDWELVVKINDKKEQHQGFDINTDEDVIESLEIGQLLLDKYGTASNQPVKLVYASSMFSQAGYWVNETEDHFDWSKKFLDMAVKLDSSILENEEYSELIEKIEKEK